MILLARYDRTGDPQDRAHAVALPHLSNLGITLMARDGRQPEPDLAGAVTAWRAATLSPSSSPQARLRAARMWGDTGVLTGRPATAADGYRAAIQALPQVAWHGLGRVTRKTHLARWSGLGSDAAAAALLAGRSGLSLELAEQGRAVLWAQVLMLRSDIGALRDTASELARRLDEIRLALDVVTDDTTSRAIIEALSR